MALNITLKRSAVPGKVPTILELQLGELALNTYDGKLYTKKQQGKNEEIIELSGLSGGSGGGTNPGPAGPKGDKGDRGDRGFAGPVGPPGKDGGEMEVWTNGNVYDLSEYINYDNSIWVSNLNVNTYEPGTTTTVDGVVVDTWTKIGHILSIFGRTDKHITAQVGDYNTSQVTENPSYLYFTDARVSASPDVVANTAKRHDAVTIGTSNGLSLSNQVLSLALSSTSTNGALSATDWNIFNNKQDALGFTPENIANKNQPGGYAGLDGGGKLFLNHIPDSLLGNVKYGGTFNGSAISASEDFSELEGMPLPTSGYVGVFFIVTSPFTYNTVSYEVGDWTLHNGGNNYVKVVNSDAVTTVFGRTGNILAVAGDYTTALVTESPGYLYYTDIRVQTYGDTRYSQLGHSHTFTSLTGKPTTIAGYGITDAVTTNTNQTGLSGNKTWTGNHRFNYIQLGDGAPTSSAVYIQPGQIILEGAGDIGSTILQPTGVYTATDSGSFVLEVNRLVLNGGSTSYLEFAANRILATNSSTKNIYLPASAGTLALLTDIPSPVDISGKEDKSNKATNLISPDNIKYPSTLAVANALSGKANLTGGNTYSGLQNIDLGALRIRSYPDDFRSYGHIDLVVASMNPDGPSNISITKIFPNTTLGADIELDLPGASGTLALTSNIPTSLSQFTNDLGNYGNWITQAQGNGYYMRSRVQSPGSGLNANSLYDGSSSITVINGANYPDTYTNFPYVNSYGTMATFEGLYESGLSFQLYANSVVWGGANPNELWFRSGNNTWRKAVFSDEIQTNNGSTLNNNISGKADGALKLWSTSHPNDFYIYNEWTGSEWLIRSNHGGEVKVNNSSKWGGILFTDVAKTTTTNYIISYNVDTNDWRPTTIGAMKSSLNISDGSTLNNNISGYAELWGGWTADFNLSSSTFGGLAGRTASGFRMVYANDVNNWLGINNGSTLNNSISGNATTAGGKNVDTNPYLSTPLYIPFRTAEGDLSTRELILTASTVHDITPSALVGIYPSTNQAVKFSSSAIKNFVGLPTSGAYDLQWVTSNGNTTTYSINVADIYAQAGIFSGTLQGTRIIAGYDSGIAGSVNTSDFLRVAGAGGISWDSYSGTFRMVNSNDFALTVSSAAGALSLQSAGVNRGYIHWTNNDEVGFLTKDGNWRMRVTNTGWAYASSFNANDWFRSSGETGWYNSTYHGGINMTDSTWVRVYNSKAFLVQNTIQADRFRATAHEGYQVADFGIGLEGIYDSQRYQSVFSMGGGYKMTQNGTSLANHYGIAWTHSNIGGQSKAGLGHQMLITDAGVTQTAIGNGIWTKGKITVGQTTGGGIGISLYDINESGSLPSYGLAFATTLNFGGHGTVTGDWATYFTMAPSAANRGWIFRNISTGVGASINASTGSATFDGYVTAVGGGGTSDIRHKTLVNFKEDLSWLDKDRTIAFKWKDTNIDNKTHYGYSAQEINGFIPDLVFKDNDEKWALNQVELLTLEIKRLKQRVKILEERK